MTSDLNKGITSITYNHLNLPTQIYWAADKKIDYLYNAAGQKVKKTVRDGNTQKIVDYLDGFQYAGGILQFFPHAEGYVKATEINESPTNHEYAFNYVFNYTDHLGNVRLSFTKDPATHQLKIMEENHYYPFGLKHGVYAAAKPLDFKEDPAGPGTTILTNVLTTSYQYKYNGKELQDELGLGLYDYGWRNYDPALGRWMNIDPLAEKSRRNSPYVYALNNPIFFIDPDGLQAEDIIIKYKDENGKNRKATYDSEKGVAVDKKGNTVSNNEFVNATVESLNYAKGGDESGIIDKIANDDKNDVFIKETDGKTETTSKGGIGILYNPKDGLAIETQNLEGGFEKTGEIQSPALGLFHELGHAFNYLYDKSGFKDRIKTPMGNGYDNKEEYDVINKYETPAAIKLGEPVRNNHQGSSVTTKGSLSKEKEDGK